MSSQQANLRSQDHATPSGPGNTPGNTHAADASGGAVEATAHARSVMMRISALRLSGKLPSEERQAMMVQEQPLAGADEQVLRQLAAALRPEEHPTLHKADASEYIPGHHQVPLSLWLMTLRRQDFMEFDPKVVQTMSAVGTTAFEPLVRQDPSWWPLIARVRIAAPHQNSTIDDPALHDANSPVRRWVASHPKETAQALREQAKREYCKVILGLPELTEAHVPRVGTEYARVLSELAQQANGAERDRLDALARHSLGTVKIGKSVEVAASTSAATMEYLKIAVLNESRTGLSVQRRRLTARQWRELAQYMQENSSPNYVRGEVYDHCSVTIVSYELNDQLNELVGHSTNREQAYSNLLAEANLWWELLLASEYSLEKSLILVLKRRFGDTLHLTGYSGEDWTKLMYTQGRRLGLSHELIAERLLSCGETEAIANKYRSHLRRILMLTPEERRAQERSQRALRIPKRSFGAGQPVIEQGVPPKS